jgi:hypothetical protein
MRRRTWRERANIARMSIVRAGRHAGQAAHKVAAQGWERARLTGAQLARRVIAAQEAARLDPGLIRQSFRSVANRPVARTSDRAWQAAYADQARRLLEPAPAARRPAPPQPAATAAWPHKDPRGPLADNDREAG